ncbi:MAG: glycosyltransferase family 2 protein [Crocinitomicaceae bacterium]|nr:glycosyltransferase family 2 protein [Crocinitomicaceae bacterium]
MCSENQKIELFQLEEFIFHNILQYKMNDTPLISILMPARNAEKYIRECLLSIQPQSYQHFELIVVDDFSTDNTYDIIGKFAQDDHRIILLQNKTKGIIPALKHAFENSKGEFITRMDADDLMPQNKLELLLEVARQNKKYIATGFVSYFSEAPITEGYQRYEAWINSLINHEDYIANIYRECIIASPNWMVNRACFDQDICWDDIQYPEDYDLVFQWHCHGYIFKHCNQLTHLWREHESRTSHHDNNYQQESFFTLKTIYFIQNECSKNSTQIQLIGKGKKGKLVSRILTEQNRSFIWYEFQDKAESTVLSVHQLQADMPAILTNWPREVEKQKEILDFLKSKNLIPGKNLWVF